MAASEEVIALVISGDAPSLHNGGVQRLCREVDGTMKLAAVRSREEFDRFAKTTGCFRRGKEIRDPNSGEVIGHELEEVSALTAV